MSRHLGFRRIDLQRGVKPGSSLELMRADLLDPLRIERAILTPLGVEVAQDNPYLGAALASAINDWSFHKWLDGVDSRLFGGITISTELPDAAANEIRRVGESSRFVEVLIVDGGLGQPFGHPVYHPIYDAAAEYGLPVAIHVGSSSTDGVAALCAGGLPSNVAEWYSVLNQSAMHHVTSFITHGVFEKWPSLRVVLLEVGFNWVPWLCGRLDAEYKTLRRESPWVKKLPSEYLREHLLFSTQPFEAPAKTGHLMELLNSFEGIEDMLVFSSDYPHWDADEVDPVARHLPSSWHPKVFYENSLRTLRWPADQRLDQLVRIGRAN